MIEEIGSVGCDRATLIGGALRGRRRLPRTQTTAYTPRNHHFNYIIFGHIYLKQGKVYYNWHSYDSKIEEFNYIVGGKIY